MSRRSSSTNRIDSGISREIGTNLALVKLVAANIDAVIKAASVDLEALLVALQDATDFTGITVESGEIADWNPTTKVLTVPTIKGDKGDAGADIRITSITPLPAGAFSWKFSDGTEYTTPSLKGGKGDKGTTGDKGDSVTIESISYQGSGVSRWVFSDGTVYQTPDLRGAMGEKGEKGDKGSVGDALGLSSISHQGGGKFLWGFTDGSSYTTPSLLGPKGETGLKGDRGLQGVSVHHMKPTATTDPEGDFHSFGQMDTYTFYGDADESKVLGWFKIQNGVNSSEARDQALASAELAARWAAEATDVIVAEGLYSAKHYSLKSQGFANTSSDSALQSKGYRDAAEVHKNISAAEAVEASASAASAAASATQAMATNPLAVIRLNPTTINENYQVPNGFNGTSTGPITISDGYTVTVGSNARWVIQ